MFRQRLPKPSILSFIRADEEDEIVARRIVGVEEVGHEAEEAETAGEDEEAIFGAQGVEDVLLKFEGEGEADGWVVVVIAICGWCRHRREKERRTWMVVNGEIGGGMCGECGLCFYA